MKKDFLTITDFTTEEIKKTFQLALDMKDGKMYRIGTAEPQKLGEFIKTRLSLFGGS